MSYGIPAITEPKKIEHKAHLTAREMDFILDSAYISGEKVINWHDYGYSTIDTCYNSILAAITRRKKMLAVEIDRNKDLVVIFNPIKREVVTKQSKNDNVRISSGSYYEAKKSINTPKPSLPFEAVDAMPGNRRVYKSTNKAKMLFSKLEENKTKLAKISVEFFDVDSGNKLEVKRLYNRIRIFAKRHNIPYKVMSFNGDSIYVERIEE